ncbi:hypothetical protein GGX14DRAFT_394859 [Mycena pura]|uniref:Uncharacterized protein n=1 Tax=Mycena pura TaxID=153505 RepID=A0AAD6VHS1_9AGAR|nr:hypothetical protein GGX14DRAFT_394859 [Mycena pura]
MILRGDEMGDVHRSLFSNMTAFAAMKPGVANGVKTAVGREVFSRDSAIIMGMGDGQGDGDVGGMWATNEQEQKLVARAVIAPTQLPKAAKCQVFDLWTWVFVFEHGSLAINPIPVPESPRKLLVRNWKVVCDNGNICCQDVLLMIGKDFVTVQLSQSPGLLALSAILCWGEPHMVNHSGFCRAGGKFRRRSGPKRQFPTVGGGGPPASQSAKWVAVRTGFNTSRIYSVGCTTATNLKPSALVKKSSTHHQELPQALSLALLNSSMPAVVHITSMSSMPAVIHDTSKSSRPPVHTHSAGTPQKSMLPREIFVYGPRSCPLGLVFLEEQLSYIRNIVIEPKQIIFVVKDVYFPHVVGERMRWLNDGNLDASAGRVAVTKVAVMINHASELPLCLSRMANTGTLTAARKHKSQRLAEDKAKAIAVQPKSLSPLSKALSSSDSEQPLYFPNSESPTQMATASEDELPFSMPLPSTGSKRKLGSGVLSDEGESAPEPPKKKRGHRQKTQSDSEVEEVVQKPPKKRPGPKPKRKTVAKAKSARVISHCLNGTRATFEGSQRLSIDTTMLFENALKLIHETIGCVSVVQKPTLALSYKHATAIQKSTPINLRTENDWIDALYNEYNLFWLYGNVPDV